MTQRQSMNRRNFLGRAVGAAGTVAFPYFVRPSALGKAGTIAPSNRIVMGFIGMGGMGYFNMCGSPYEMMNTSGFIRESDVQAVAVCDVDANRCREACQAVNTIYGNKDCASYNDFRELLARDDIDAVMIATPDHWHALIGIAAVKAGKDVYCEKPLGHNFREGQAICETVRRYGAIWQTGSQQRSMSLFRRVCELVRNGRIGEVKLAIADLPPGSGDNVPTTPVPVPEGFDYDFWLGPAPKVPYCKRRCHSTFRNMSDYSHGSVVDHGAHQIDIAQWGMDADGLWPVEVRGEATFNREGLWDCAINYRLEFKYKEGFTIVARDWSRSPVTRDGQRFTRGWGGANFGILFDGSKGWIRVNRGGMNIHPRSVLREPTKPDDIRLYKSHNHKRNFLDCIKTRKQTAAPPQFGHHSVGLVHMGLISARLGRVLRWDVNTESFKNDEQANRMLYRTMRSPWRL